MHSLQLPSRGAASGFRHGRYLLPTSRLGLASGWNVLNQSSVSSQPPFHFSISLRQFEHALRKNCLSLSKVLLMDTDVFMMINKISETECYGHTETLKCHSLSWKMVYVKDDGGNF